MKLHEVTSLEGFVHLERHVNNPKYSETARYSEVDIKYHPRFGEPHFDLPYVLIDAKESEILLDNPSEAARKLTSVKNGKLPFYLHPVMLENAVPRGFLKVAPSSSTRTVIPLDGPQQPMLKLHLEKRISRFIRRLRASSIRHSVEISRALSEAGNDSLCPKRFGFLPESVGVIHRPHQENAFGYIVRESTPRPYVSDRRYLLPIFSLYSQDTKAAHDEPILLQLAAANKKKPVMFLLEDIIEPLIESWVFTLTRHGILLESHAQNTLLEIDANFRPTRIIHRDFQSLPVDPRIRKALELPMPFTKHIIGQDDYPEILEHSLVYDHFVGDYLFLALEEFVVKRLGVTENYFRDSVKTIFRKYLPNQYDYFPRGHVVFAKGISGDNKYDLIYHNEPPLFR